MVNKIKNVYYAYTIECFVRNKWRHLRLVVAEPSKGFRDMLDSVKPKYRNEVRIKRVSDVNLFRALASGSGEMMVADSYNNHPIKIGDSLLVM